ncbi:AAA family ATPase [Candidatus Mesenet endosymbiont of Agriotes lineatus]|uniref:AAA family ATPase n=1 Tax=Candidatus Mesenet endosymbiont of Agriotes lineatus TaxID=3077948 RepID=UPI0030D4DC7D
MENIIGHKSAKQTLINNKSVQSWLICGQKGIGKATLAQSFASFVLTKSISYDHPDFLIIEDPLITVERIRYLKNFLYLSPKYSDYKVVLIDSIEAVNNNARNAMLKILEEPTQNSIIIIISHKPYHVPATIKSRCFQLKLSPLSYDETKQVIAKFPSEQKLCEELFSLFCGLPGIIINTASSKINDLYQSLLRVLQGQSDVKTANCIINTDIELDIIAYILQNLILRIVKSKIGIEWQSNEKFITKNIGYSISYWYEKCRQVTDLFISAEKFNLDKGHTLTNLVNILN